MIQRDSNGLIGQHNRMYPNYFDLGDSCARCGVMALAGSKLDQDVLYKFTTTSKELVRHPTDPLYNKPELSSRDNLIQWAAGVYESQDPVSQAVVLHYAKLWFINADILTPDVKLYLYKCARAVPPFWLMLLGTPWMGASLLWSTKLYPEEEQNKILCQCVVFGPAWTKKLVAWHPDLEKNLILYWSLTPWRDQSEIKIGLWALVQREINK